MRWPSVAVATLALLFCATASAQTPSPILQHYRAYEAALDAGDLPTAEREAAAALAASEARDGDGGRTAVLALNLATVRFLSNNAAGALEPGRRALALTQAHGEERTGVSPALAQLIVARGELAAAVEGAPERLMQALHVAVESQLPSAEVYDGARQLAAWSLRNERFDESARAWSIAATYAEGARLPAAHARGIALIGGAASIMMADIGDRRRRIDPDVARESYGMLHQALQTLATVPGVSTEAEVTPAMRSFAEALAWRAVLHAKLNSDGLRIPDVREAEGDGADGLNEIGATPAPLGQPRCLVNILPRPGARLYPSEAVRRGHLGGVAVLFRLNEAGELVGADALASVGGEEFGESVENMRSWRVTRRDDSPENCRMAMSVIRSVAFQFGG